MPIAPDPNAAPGRGPPLSRAGAELSIEDNQILDGLGLKLEPSKTTIEVLVIDSIEKPSENWEKIRRVVSVSYFHDS